ncbi:hypothetical protein ACIBHX_13205 [Nonomuraea sp. NPDC050536]|uniref:hypothetical protein n=1 Tax=Nonomuraea sp. NPDC050536 TaxID=3364366 RepID=UPI0037C5C9C6
MGATPVQPDTPPTKAKPVATAANRSLRPLAEQLLSGPRSLVRRIVDAAQVRDRDDHVERLCALIDGLAFKAAYVPTADDPSGHLRLVGKQLDHILSDR